MIYSNINRQNNNKFKININKYRSNAIHKVRLKTVAISEINFRSPCIMSLGAKILT